MFLSAAVGQSCPVSTIISRITLSLIAVAILQSCKLFWASDYFHSEHTYSKAIHIVNLHVHLAVFAGVLFAVYKKHLLNAKLLLVLGFCSYIASACLLWQVNVHIQYYFLLSMFICAYLFNSQQNPLLYACLAMHLALFLGFQFFLPSILHQHTEQVLTFLYTITVTNDIVFTLSCLLCALYIRHIIANNWQEIMRYQYIQTNLLNKLFPPQLMPALVQHEYKGVQQLKQKLKQPLIRESCQQKDTNSEPSTPELSNISINKTLGVIFLDICNFTHMQLSEKNNGNLSAIFQLFSGFDESLSHLDAKRIKTNGDQYIVIIGLSSANVNDEYIAKHTFQACRLMRKVANCEVKIGAALGDVRCGVFDPMYPNFDIWGETVIRAARLESLARAGEIIVDKAIYESVNNDKYHMQHRNVALKGLGEHSIYCNIHQLNSENTQKNGAKS